MEAGSGTVERRRVGGTVTTAELTVVSGRTVDAEHAAAAALGVPGVSQRARRDLWWGAACLTTDLSMLLLAGIAASVATLALGVAPLALDWKAATGAALVGLMAHRGLYRSPKSLRTLDHVAGIAGAGVIAVGAMLSYAALFHPPVAAVEILRHGAVAVAFVVAGRLSFYRAFLRGRRAGEGLRPTLVVGAGRVGRMVAQRLHDLPELGLRPVGFLDKDPLSADESDEVPVLGASWDLEEVVARQQVEQVIICFSTAPDEVILRLVNRCEALGVDVAIVPRLFEKTTTRFDVDHLGGVPLLHARPLDPRSWRFSLKYAVDRVIAAAALVLLAPVLLVTAIAVYSSLGAPIFFRQQRVGRDGRRFTILKFRSMRPSSAAVPEQERLTRVGALIRRLSIDELPQLINVVRGEMSLVGPRPERPELVGAFEQSIYRYGERHRVKSGITGWAQVHGLGRGDDRFGDASLSDRIEWDNFYIENWSFWLDLKIAVMTFCAVLRFRQQ